MTGNKTYDVVIVGGSYSGLAAAMALGRALKSVLVIDAGKPCNKQTPHSHNFLTNDGKAPGEIAAVAKLQVKQYDTVNFFTGTVIRAAKMPAGFEVGVAGGETFSASKLVFATGIKDLLPAIEGAGACWGISVLHCPYCHGYEVRNRPTGILGNGDGSFEFAALISNWTSDLTLFTNGNSTFTSLQKNVLHERRVDVVEKEIAAFDHEGGYIKNIFFGDGSTSPVEIMYAPVPFEQHSKLPEILGCALTEDGYIKTDIFYETTVRGVYAIGDNASKMRTIANAVSMGTSAGMSISKRMIVEEFVSL